MDKKLVLLAPMISNSVARKMAEALMKEIEFVRLEIDPNGKEGGDFKCEPNRRIKGNHTQPFYRKGRW